MKKILIQIRTLTKLSLLIFLSIFLIVGAVILIYKPIYSVSLNGEIIGYSANKSKLQARITDYIENGNEETNNENLAFVSIDNMPTYKMCLLKRGITTNDDEIFETVTKSGVPYYKYYAILDGEDEKAYVSNFDEAEEVVSKLKKKESNNIEDISIIEKYETDLKRFTNVKTAARLLNIHLKYQII